MSLTVYDDGITNAFDESRVSNVAAIPAILPCDTMLLVLPV